MKKGIELIYTIGWVSAMLYLGSVYGINNAFIALGAVIAFYFSQQIYLLIFGNNTFNIGVSGKKKKYNNEEDLEEDEDDYDEEEEVKRRNRQKLFK